MEDEQHWCRGELARDMNALSVDDGSTPPDGQLSGKKRRNQ